MQNLQRTRSCRLSANFWLTSPTKRTTNTMLCVVANRRFQCRQQYNLLYINDRLPDTCHLSITRLLFLYKPKPRRETIDREFHPVPPPESPLTSSHPVAHRPLPTLVQQPTNSPSPPHQPPAPTAQVQARSQPPSKPTT